MLHGSLNYDYAGRRRKKSKPRGEVYAKRPAPAFTDLHGGGSYRRNTPTYPSADGAGKMNTTVNTEKQMEKQRISRQYTVAPAYNKAGYQVISPENYKDIGR